MLKPVRNNLKPLKIRCEDAQIAAMFVNAIQAGNCGEWTPWGPCIWLKGKNPRWERSYFDQLLPGRTGCREHIFFKLLRDRWGVCLSCLLCALIVASLFYVRREVKNALQCLARAQML
uniref:G_PROTEIN_RECEP_F2_3 domain-containing protein n=1 Tax=Ascaris lumbricoides TaxID=6252 RepID=A0A0M3HMR5_ASCLU